MAYKKRVLVVGIDEAGRGPLAGPVFVGAVMFFGTKAGANKLLYGVRDSKKLSEGRREEWFKKISVLRKKGKLFYSVSLISHKIIDKKGISFAINKGVTDVLKKLKIPSNAKILLDGSLRAPFFYKNQKTIIRGDDLEPIISSASIVAKVSRDRHMRIISKKFPNYGFEIHKGYGTKRHYRAIKKKGLSSIHRKSFLKKFDI